MKKILNTFMRYFKKSKKAMAETYTELETEIKVQIKKNNNLIFFDLSLNELGLGFQWKLKLNFTGSQLMEFTFTYVNDGVTVKFDGSTEMEAFSFQDRYNMVMEEFSEITPLFLMFARKKNGR